MNDEFRQVGDFQVTALSDGCMVASLALLSGIDVTDAGEIKHRAGITDPDSLHIFGYLIRGCGRTILVDSGTGGANNIGGQLQTNLQACGVMPDEVDTVLLTHAHPDHIGGLLDEEGEAMYPRAHLYLHPDELEYWLDDNLMAQANERQQRNFERARRTLSAYQPRLHLLDESPIVEGIRAVPLPGHTPGHTGFRIDSRQSSLIIWGDIVHFPFIQTARPDVTIAFDIDPAQAQASRKRILAQIAEEGTLVAGMHFAGTGFAQVYPVGSGYRIVYSAA